MSYPVVLPGKCKCILRNQEVEETVPAVKTPKVMGGVKDSHPLLENISKHEICSRMLLNINQRERKVF